SIWAGLFIDKKGMVPVASLGPAISPQIAIAVKAFGSSQVGSWVQAIGVILAFWWATKIARDEKESRNDDKAWRDYVARQNANIAAYAIGARIDVVNAEIQGLLDSLSGVYRLYIDNNQPYIYSAEKLRGMVIWNMEEVRPLIILPNNCASYLAFVAEAINPWVNRFEQIASNSYIYGNEERLRLDLEPLMRDMVRAQSFLNTAKEECEKFRREMSKSFTPS
ncbi:hypothetical protein LJC19_02845, partial [Oxalobacter sp. OttesenSCG-928-P03]|nr:hypothetical protein [Oxalobacter sp. OttesenSCG-928-P03]